MIPFLDFGEISELFIKKLFVIMICIVINYKSIYFDG